MATDWYLPSKGDLNLMYTVLKAYGVGGFTDDWYWSSSEDSDRFADMYRFSDGLLGAASKNTLNYVRAVRTFIADASLYSLRSIGPGGGWVFYKSGAGPGNVTYMEAAKAEMSATIAWITGGDTQTELIGTTSKNVGTGLANTNAMAADDGYTGGAAKVCLDYVDTGYAWVYSTAQGVPITKVSVDEVSTNLAAQRTAKGLGVVTAPSITQYSTKILKTHMDTWRTMCADVVKYGATNAPTWGESITQYATAVKALHFNELKQVADDAKNMARCYTSVCAAACGIACTTTCTTDCGQTCSTTCSATCSNTCQSTYCTTTCSSGCTTACTGCTTKCSGGCSGATCTATCDNANCLNNCYIYCQINCAATCKVVCSNAQSACASCTGMCNNSNCKQLCGLNCTGACTYSCYTTCTSCTSTCEHGCTGSCESICSGGCGNTCTAACTSNGGSCGGTCSATTCSAGCGVNCNVVCSTDCNTTCQYNCYTTCLNGCYSGCTDTARVGVDAGSL